MDNVELLRIAAMLPMDPRNRELLKSSADEIERLRRIIWNLLDDGDETDRAAARAALKGDE